MTILMVSMIIKNLLSIQRKKTSSAKLKKDYPSDGEIERTKEIIKLFNIKNGEELTEIYSKSDVLLLTCV